MTNRVNRELEKGMNPKVFSWCTTKVQLPRCNADIREFWKFSFYDWMSWLPARLDHGKKFTYYESLVVALKKKMQNFCTFSRLYLYFYKFSRSGQCFTNFLKTFSGIQDSKRNQLQNHSLKVKEKRKSCANLWWKTSGYWIDTALRTSAGVL